MFRWLFKRRTREPPILINQSKCSHTWKDFPWYMQSSWTAYANNTLNPGIYTDIAKGRLVMSIFEPYICIHCKERKDIKLYESSHDNMTLGQASAYIRNEMEKFKDNIKPIPVVEDMIHDYVLVDQEKLKIAEKILNRGEKENG